MARSVRMVCRRCGRRYRLPPGVDPLPCACGGELAGPATRRGRLADRLTGAVVWGLAGAALGLLLAATSNRYSVLRRVPTAVPVVIGFAVGAVVGELGVGALARRRRP